MQRRQSDEASERITIHRLEGAEAGDRFADDVRRGLTADAKFLLPKYFYNELGSLLFDAICLLPEYYLTRAESEIFAQHSDAIVEQAARGKQLTLVELGSGSATKTRRIVVSLLQRQSRLAYIPVDISPAALEAGAHALLKDFDALEVTAYAGDYDAAFSRLPESFEPETHALVLFLGSNIGNFDREGARAFLLRLRGVLRAGDALLLGADLKKERATLEAAYDDALGVTAAFNLNVLARINQELQADFSLRHFRHAAHYNELEGRVEMHIESLRSQAVRVGALDLVVNFREGERIHTENSHKYDLAELSTLAAATGFELTQTWLDAGERFSSNLFIAG